MDLELGHDSTGNIKYKTRDRKFIRPRPNILDGQFARPRWTCSELTDYMRLGQTLKQKFVDKGYQPSEIERIFQKHKSFPSKNGKEAKLAPDTKYTIRFCTQFSDGARMINKILDRHWRMLLEDPILNKHLQPKPTVIYRRLQTLKNILTPSKVKDLEREESTHKCFFSQTGNYAEYQTVAHANNVHIE